MSEPWPDPGDQRRTLVALYDTALPDVYGYLASRCGSATIAEDLTAETFLAAANAVVRRSVPQLTVAWLIGVARHKLVDHWRRREREQRLLAAVADDPGAPDEEDDWDIRIDAILARDALAALGANHRAALPLRYVDGLSVPEGAEHVGRTRGATEALIVRARAAFRAEYERAGAGEEDR